MCGIGAIVLKSQGFKQKLDLTDMLHVLGFFQQQRGQEGSGMVVSDGKQLKSWYHMGDIEQLYEIIRAGQQPDGTVLGLVHSRYATQGKNGLSTNAKFELQPVLGSLPKGAVFALVTNGNLRNYETLRDHALSQGYVLSSTNEAELMLRMLITQQQENEFRGQGDFSMITAIQDLQPQLAGAYSTIVSTRKTLFVFQDPLQIRPQWVCETDQAFIIASESHAITKVVELFGLSNPVFSEPKSQTITKITADNLEIFDVSSQPLAEKHCVFELMYFSHHRGDVFGYNIQVAREQLGAALAKQESATFRPDIVVAVPNSGIPAAWGYAEALKVPYCSFALERTPVGRSFTLPTPAMRQRKVRMKFTANPRFLGGKKVVLVDDTLVRGTTMSKLVGLLFAAGALEVHIRIAAPQIRCPCYLGIAMPTYSELAINQYGSVEGIESMFKAALRQWVSVGRVLSLNYLSQQTSHQFFSPEKFCHACFDGNYPV